nr:sugar ABC transporter ATP-binding protein [Planosporangium flavigriseum]
MLRVESLTKQFPGVLALDNVSLDVDAGEVHVLLGENGAGKSTLIKMLAGLYLPSSGRILLGGEEMSFAAPRDARAAGISTVFQELSLVPTLTVAENLFLGRLPSARGIVARRRLRDMARAALDRIGADIPLGAKVSSLPRSAQQLVEIAKGLLGEARLLILDEPTASLGDRESERLLELVRTLSGQGLGIIYITHRMREISQIGHRVTVLRDGRLIDTVPADTGEDRLVELMTGRALEDLYPSLPRTPGAELLTLHDVTGPELHGISLSVRAGEIVGVAGLLGSGKSSVGRTCFGLDPLHSGRIEVQGKPLKQLAPAAAITRGIVYYPSDRRHQGLALCRPLFANITLGSLRHAKASTFGLVNRRRERSVATSYVERLSIRPGDIGRRTELFSGGNQQKAVLARGLIHGTQVHIFDEPTVGIDVSAKADVYRVMSELAAAGKAVLLISSDLPEVLGMSDRVYVLHEGHVVSHLTGDEITESAVLSTFFGEASTTTPGGPSA